MSVRLHVRSYKVDIKVSLPAKLVCEADVSIDSLRPFAMTRNYRDEKLTRRTW